MTTKAIADWLETAVAAALTVTVHKGYPAWGRPTVTPPLAAILFVEHDPGTTATVGRQRATKSTTFEVVAYAANEVALWAFVDLLDAYWPATATPTISGVRVKVVAGSIVRLEADNIPEQARYACRQQVTFVTP